LLGTFHAAGWNGVVAAASYATASVAIVFAILHTSVANVMFIISLAPFFAALLDWAFLGEAIDGRTWVSLPVYS
jgi:drug/metabolite transporter (DMT)-like permease